MNMAAPNFTYAFADFRLDPTRRLLRQNGETVTLHPKAFDLLVALVENRDRVLSKDELLQKIWADQFVEENNLAVQIFALRKIFGEKKGEHQYIVTIPGKGYRFVAEVRAENQETNGSFERNNSHGFAKIHSETVDFEDNKKNEKRGFAPYLLPVSIGVCLIVGLAAAFYWLGEDELPPKHLKFTKLTTSGKIINAALTADGKYAVFAQSEPSGQSLWLKQIGTGSQTRIADSQPIDYVSLSVSPDSKFIYYSALAQNQAGGPMRRIPLLGGAAQEITDVETGVSVSFAPDGKQFAYTASRSSLKETRLMLADADGANSRVLIRADDRVRKFATYKANPVAWSPDGAQIACSVTQKNADGAKSGILLVDPLSGEERVLLAPRFAWIDNVVWTDAENLAFVASETDEWTSQIWTISRKTGAARQLTNDLHRYLWLSAASGALLTIQQNAASSLKTADFDENLQEFQPREILSETDIDYAAFASGDAILYVSRASGKREIWRVGKDGAGAAQVTTDAQVTYGFAISPIDDSIVFSSPRDGGKHSLWAADAGGGNFRRLTDGDDLAPQFAPDGNQIVFQHGLYEVPTVWRVAAGGGSPVQLFKQHSLKPTVSPDGARAAFYFMDFADGGAWRIGLVSTATGEFLGKLSFPTTVNERRMRWHPSGRFLGQIFNTGEAANLLLLPTGGGQPRVIAGLGKGRINSFEWSRDGRQIVFTETNETQDAVLLTDF